MSDNKHGSASGKGYYIALILCAAAIGITSYVYFRNENRNQQTIQEETTYIPAGTFDREEDVPALATQPAVRETTPAGQTGETAPPEKKTLKTQLPVSGEEIFGYSMETLCYNETTRDWRVHNGVDLAAEPGTPVGAAADGTVLSVEEDDSMGYTVMIRHEGGYTTCYSSLSENIPVNPGDTVVMGQTIGYAGSTALVETTMGSHVHFGVICRSEPMDPAEFLALGDS